MSELATLARPYAAAVFKRAKETESAEKWSQNLAFMSDVLLNQDISVIVDNPKISRTQVSEIMLDICKQQIDAECENFLKLLIQNNRLSLLVTIKRLFEAYKAEDEGYVDVEVSTAYEFEENAWQNFVATLERILNKSARITVSLDKSLIGGVWVRAGDRVIDGSIKGQLQYMQKTLK